MYSPMFRKYIAKELGTPLHRLYQNNDSFSPSSPSDQSSEVISEPRVKKKQKRNPKRSRTTLTKKKPCIYHASAHSKSNRPSWNDSTIIEYQPVPPTITPCARSRRRGRRINGSPLQRYTSKPGIKKSCLRTVRDKTSETGDDMNFNKRMSEAESNFSRSTSLSGTGGLKRHSCDLLGCSRKIKGPGTFAKANLRPLCSYVPKYRKRSVSFGATSSKSDGHCTRDAMKRPSDGPKFKSLFAQNELCREKDPSQTSPIRKPSRKKVGLRRSRSASLRRDRECCRDREYSPRELQYPKCNDLCQYSCSPCCSLSCPKSWDSRNNTPMRTKSCISKSPCCKPSYENTKSPCCKPSYDNTFCSSLYDDPEKLLVNKGSTLNTYCRRLCTKHFDENKLMTPEIMNCFNRLDNIKNSSLLANSDQCNDRQANIGGILNAMPCASSIYDPVEQASNTLSKLRLKEIELLDKYQPQNIVPNNSSREYSPGSGSCTKSCTYLTDRLPIVRASSNHWPSCSLDWRSGSDWIQPPTARYTCRPTNFIRENRYVQSKPSIPIRDTGFLASSRFQRSVEGLSEYWAYPYPWERTGSIRAPRPFSSLPRNEYHLINKYMDDCQGTLLGRRGSASEANSATDAAGLKKSEVRFENDKSHSNCQSNRRELSNSFIPDTRKKSFNFNSTPMKDSIPRSRSESYKDIKPNSGWSSADNLLSSKHTKKDASLSNCDGDFRMPSNGVTDSCSRYRPQGINTSLPASAASSVCGLANGGLKSSFAPHKLETYLDNEHARLQKLGTLIK